jgi:type IV pilus assembly protein PilV
MQTYSMALTNSGQTRQKATLLAYQMADRLRANKKGADAGAYNAVAAVALPTCLSTAGCPNEVDVSAADYSVWLDDVRKQLKNGDGKVCLVAAADRTVCDAGGQFLAINLTWEDSVGASRLTTTVCEWTVTPTETFCR